MWLWIRIGLLAAAVFSGVRSVAVTQHLETEFVQRIRVYVCVGIHNQLIGMAFIAFGLFKARSVLPHISAQWERPRWRSNFLSWRNPWPAIHLAYWGTFMAAAGILAGQLLAYPEGSSYVWPSIISVASGGIAVVLLHQALRRMLPVSADVCQAPHEVAIQAAEEGESLEQPFGKRPWVRLRIPILAMLFVLCAIGHWVIGLLGPDISSGSIGFVEFMLATLLMGVVVLTAGTPMPLRIIQSAGILDWTPHRWSTIFDAFRKPVELADFICWIVIVFGLGVLIGECLSPPIGSFGTVAGIAITIEGVVLLGLLRLLARFVYGSASNHRA